MLLSLVCSILVLVVAVLAGPEPNQEDLHVHLHGLDKVASDAGREKGESTKMNISGEAPEMEGGQDYVGGSDGGFYPRHYPNIEDEDEDDYIVGGTRAYTQAYPFIGRYTTTSRRGYYGGCTGSLVSSTVVLTATHCFYDEGKIHMPSCGYFVFNDDDKFNGNNRNEIWRKIRLIVRYNYDLAAVFLEKEVNLTPVKIATKLVRDGARVKALGYGMTGFDRNGKYLNEIDLRVKENHSTRIWSKIEKRAIKWEWIETNVGPGNEGPCAGDSGGPLLVRRNRQYELLATLTGGGYDCREGKTDRKGDRWNSLIGSGPHVGIYYCK